MRRVRDIGRLVCVAVAFLSVCGSARSQAEKRARLVESLQAKRLDASGSLLAILDSEGFAPGRAALDLLHSLSLAEVTRVQKAYARVGAGERPIARVLEAIHARLEGADARVIEALLPLLEDRRYAVEAGDGLGRAGLRLCRRGDERGLVGLEAVRSRWPVAAWSLGNVALGLRLLGRYDISADRYEELLVRTQRAAWVLNDAGLLEIARGRRDRALRLLLEGSKKREDPSGSDNCRGNAAILLLDRNRRGDRLQAEVLLESVVRRDPTRQRARFWLERLRRPGARLPNGRRLEPVSTSTSKGGSPRAIVTTPAGT